MSIIEGISDPVINALGWTLIHSLWQLLVIALLWRLALYLARNSAASLQYNFSLLALLAVPVVSGFTFFRQYRIYSNASAIVSLDFEESVFRASTQGSAFFLVQKNYPSALLQQLEAWMPYLFWIYLGGLMLFSLHSMISYSRLYSLRRRSIQPMPLNWQRKLQALQKIAGLKRKQHVFVSTRISIPAVIGFLKPVILLPAAMLSGLSPGQVETILLHELYHIRRKDHYINMLQTLMEILFFYHPAIWWISRQMRQEREKAVDEWVVAQTGSPMAYARALVSLEEKRSFTPQPVIAATQSKNLLLIRIKNIMTMKTNNFNSGKKMAALLVILSAVISVAWYNPSYTVNYGHAGPDYQPEATLLSYYQPEPLAGSLAQATSPAADPPAQPGEPRRIHLRDGKSIGWEELSEEDRAKLQAAMEEMRLSIQEVNRELREKFNSGEFRQQMQQVQQEVRQAMEEMREKQFFNNAEFREEMEKARQEVQRAMQEVRREMQEFNSEEFRQEMKKAGEEMRKAMEEMRQEMIEKGYDPDKHPRWMNEENWENFNRDMQNLQLELQKIGPEILRTMEDLRLDEIIREATQSFTRPDTTRVK